MTYFPKLRKQDSGDSDVTFNFKAELHSSNSFSKICHPKGYTFEEHNENFVVIEKKNFNFFELKRSIEILFKYTNSEMCQFSYQRNDKIYPGKVAVMSQFMPSP
jgi:hypothetical protein